MKRAWHLAQKDLRRFRLLGILVAGVVLLRFSLGLAIFYRSYDLALVPALGAAVTLLSVLELTIAYIGTAALALEDPLVGSSAGWMTRPISGSMLWRAKLLGASLLFLVLPLGLHVPWWLWGGAGPAALAGAAGELLAVRLVVISLSLLVSAATDTLPRFLAYSVIPLVAFGTIFLYHWTILASLGSEYDGHLMRTQFAALLELLLLGLSLAGAYGYFSTRRPGWAIAAGVGAVVASLALTRATPGLSRRLHLPSWPRADAIGVPPAPTFRAATFSPGAGEAGGVPGELEMVYELAHDEGGAFAGVNFVRHRITTPDGRETIRDDHRREYTDYARPPDPAILPRALDPAAESAYRRRFLRASTLPEGDGGARPPPSRVPSRVPAVGRSGLAVTDEPISDVASFWMTRYRFLGWAETPLRPGGRLRLPGAELRIAAVRPEKEGLGAVLISRSMRSTFLDQIFSLPRTQLESEFQLRVTAADQRQRGTVNSSSFPVTEIGGIQFIYHYEKLTLPPVWQPATDTWLQAPAPAATLYCAAFQPTAKYEVSVTSRDLHPATRSAAPGSSGNPAAPVRRRVRIQGEIRHPGVFVVDQPSPEAQWQALVGEAARGLKSDADPGAIRLLRGKAPVGIRVSLQEFIAGREKRPTGLPALEDGDVIEVPSRP